jgi:hypothetical protein
MAHPWVFFLLMVVFSGGRIGLPALVTLLALACS